ncbi:MAG: glycoside hydrolase family 2 protein [Bacteroidales bacterium]|nr:glycoside hydrolase family 2 protein [Bacteroidales bacterium]
MKKFLFLILPFVLLSCIDNDADLQPLNNGWNLKTDTLSIDLQVDIPSVVQADLYKNGIIPHPYTENIEPELLWIPQRVWDYSLTFDVDKNIWQKDNIDLIFNGLDTYADVWLNGVKILHSDNMFVRYEKEVKNLLKKNGNELKVRFYPFDVQRDSLIETYRMRFPEKYAVMRKAAYQNGWDWAPRYLNIGIWKDVELHGWSGFKIENVSILTENLDGNDAEMSANIRIFSNEKHNLKFVVSNEGNQLCEKTVAVEGRCHVKIPFELKNANLWWPNGIWEHTMTDFVVDFYKNDELIGSQKVKTGIRRIELVEEPDSIGSAMYFKVNGKKIYIKGANYIPEEMIETWMSKEKTIKLLGECVPTHFNMLRVWGGGIYPPDWFYDVCDSLGIMVWQDFMFAGTTYPYSNEFLNNVKEEAIQQVLNYQNHPSLALWCGNNEVSEGYVNWGWQKSMGWTDDDYAEMKRGMDTLFVDIFSEVVENYDGTRPYWSSSPKNGWGKPESLTEGDVHYWGVWWGELPYEAYLEKVGRFNSEFGYQAYPNIDTKHQKHPRGEELIQKHIERYICRDVYRNVSKNDSIRDVYYSQLSQAYGVGLAIEAQRAAKPRSMGTLYWQLNDAWPVISWSSIDYEGNKKALHWKLKELYAPILIGVLPTTDGNFTVYANSDHFEPIDGTLTLIVCDFDGNLLKSYSAKVFILENGCVHLPLDVNDFVKDFDKTEIYISMKLADNEDNSVYSSRLQYLAYPKDLKLKEVELNPIVEMEWGIGAITLTSPTLVKDVYIELPEGCTDLSDNFFDVEPNKPKYVMFRTQLEKPEVKITTLNCKN